MTSRVVFRAAARREFDLAAEWYGARRVGLGERFVQAVAVALEHAGTAPQRCPVTLRDLRRVRVPGFPYRIYFRATADALVVLAVFHVRRDPMTLSQRLPAGSAF